MDLVASYSANGIGGTQIERSNTGLGSAVTGTIPGGYLDALRSIGALDYPTWSVGVNVTMPLGKKAADASYARGQVEQRQAALGSISWNCKRLPTSPAPRKRCAPRKSRCRRPLPRVQLAQKRLEAEQTRRSSGLSTTFLVSQAQRDLATAENTELRAMLDYRTALADFELAQEAP